MTYDELKIIMESYRIGAITRIQMEVAFGLWQLKEHHEIPVIDGVITSIPMSEMGHII